MIEVIEPGLLTTVQDEGRPGLSHLGISPGGAADPDSYRVANRLVDNVDEAALEMTLKGGRFLFHTEARIALAGSDFGAELEGTALPPWRDAVARAGQTLSLGASRDGARCYLAVRGGIEVAPVLGSRSTLLSARFGGWEGRPLKRGDRLSVGTSAPRVATARLSSALPDRGLILVTAGSEWEELDDEAKARFLSSEFLVTEHSNRSGLRLSGPSLALNPRQECLTEGVTWGTVQLPPSGQPLVLMNEQQTTGGYPKIAHVIRCDLPKLGQLRPRDKVRFRLIDIDEAVKLLRDSQEKRWI